MIKRKPNPQQSRQTPNGNVLVGCLIALGIALVLVIISTIFVVNSWRGWISGGIKQGLTAVLDETQIQQLEKDEINAHIDTLMTRFVDKDISTEDLFLITAEIFEGPLLPMGIVEASYAGYFDESDLDDEAKANAKIQLGRLAYGIHTEDISMDDLDAILAPISVPADENNGAVQIQVGSQDLELKAPKDVTTEELLEVIANAQAAADQAEVDTLPPTIDLSDEVGKAIAKALGEDPELWVPGAEDDGTAEDNTTEEDTAKEDTTEDDTTEDIEPGAESDDGP